MVEKKLHQVLGVSLRAPPPHHWLLSLYRKHEEQSSVLVKSDCSDIVAILSHAPLTRFTPIRLILIQIKCFLISYILPLDDDMTRICGPTGLLSMGCISQRAPSTKSPGPRTNISTKHSRFWVIRSLWLAIIVMSQCEAPPPCFSLCVK